MLADECLSATFFAPTSQAIASSEWPGMKKNDSVLIGSILYHLVPFQVGLRETFLCGAAAISVNAKSALHCVEPAVPPV